MRNLLLLSSILLVMLLGSCKPGVPREYVQPRTMEKILFDYHIALGMAQEQYPNDEERRVYEQAYKLAVLQKYDVSEEKFEASMQYYMRHTERLHKIYEGLTERLEEEAVAQGVSEGEINQLGNNVAAGDTADIWAGEKALVLMKQSPYNSYSFLLKADSSFHKGDRLTLRFNTQYLMQDGSRDAVIVIAMRLANDSVVTQYQHMMTNSRQTITINDTKNIGIKEIRGYFMLTPDVEPTTTLRILFISDIKMTRVHTEDTNTPTNDTDKNEKDNKDKQRSDSSATLRKDSSEDMHPQPFLKRRQ